MRRATLAWVGWMTSAAGITVACGSDSESPSKDETQLTEPAVPGNGPSGDNGGGFGKNDSKGVVLGPKNAIAIIDTTTTPATPGSVVFKVIDQTTAGDRDVTAQSALTLSDPSLGTMNGAVFTSLDALPAGVLGKSTTVSAKTPSAEALATLTVVQMRKSGSQRDFFFLVPYEEAPTPPSDILAFSTNIKRADVAFVMDTTGSMQNSIDNLKSALQGTLFSQLQAAIPDVGLAVVDHKDFNQFGPLGDPLDPWSIMVRQTVTTNLGAAQAAVNAMSATGGGDLPEAQIGAMHYVLSGDSNNAHPPIGQHYPPAGRIGGVDFRVGSVPVVVEITDAPWHNPSGTKDINGLKYLFGVTKAKFVDITSGDESQANDLSDATGSNVPVSAFSGVGCAAGMCCTDVGGAGRPPSGPGGTCRLNFRHSNGSGVSAGVVKAIQAIAVGTIFDVKAIVSNDPANEGGVDATKFIKVLRAMDEGDPANGCPPTVAKDTDGDGVKDTFANVTSGTPVCFEVIASKNVTVPPSFDPKFFKAFVDVVSIQGDLELDRRAVLFLVPPKARPVK